MRQVARDVYRLKPGDDVWSRRRRPSRAALIDAHAGVPAAERPDRALTRWRDVHGDLVIAEREQLVPGERGVVEDGIVAGMFAYEAG